MARIDMRVRTLEREMGEIKDDLKAATKEVTETAVEMKLVAQELRSALRSAVATAAKPFDRLSWGWKALVGLGTAVLGLIAAAGGLLSIIDRMK